jgi:drug/metabolite transporter (DMT)-like permease
MLRSPAGVAIALCSAMGAGYFFVIIRKVARYDLRSEVVINALMVGGMVTSPFGLLLGPSPVMPSSWEQYLMLVGLALAGYFGQICQTKGLMMEAAGPASAMRFLDIPWCAHACTHTHHTCTHVCDQIFTH